MIKVSEYNNKTNATKIMKIGNNYVNYTFVITKLSCLNLTEWIHEKQFTSAKSCRICIRLVVRYSKLFILFDRIYLYLSYQS